MAILNPRGQDGLISLGAHNDGAVLSSHVDLSFNPRVQQIIVIFDGQCQFCRESLTWVESRLELHALPFQSTALSDYGLSLDQCSESVFVIAGDQSLSGADAVHFLLQKRGNTIAAAIIRKSGRLSHVGYAWVATHRSSLLVGLLSRLLRHANRPKRTSKKR